MEMASKCTEQAVQEFLLERGGRVRQMELIDHFVSLPACNDQSNGGLDGEVLGRIVDSVGFVAVENGDKFVCLNAAPGVRSEADGHDEAECNGNIQDQESLDNKHVNGNPENTAGQTGEAHTHDDDNNPSVVSFVV